MSFVLLWLKGRTKRQGSVNWPRSGTALAWLAGLQSACERCWCVWEWILMCWLEDIQFQCHCTTMAPWSPVGPRAPDRSVFLSDRQSRAGMESGGIGYISIFAAGSGKPLAGDSGINTHYESLLSFSTSSQCWLRIQRLLENNDQNPEACGQPGEAALRRSTAPSLLSRRIVFKCADVTDH